jgi:hypothetical protein
MELGDDATTSKTLRRYRVRHTFSGYEVRPSEARNGVGDQGSRWVQMQRDWLYPILRDCRLLRVD